MKVDLHSHFGIIEINWKGHSGKINKGDPIKTVLQHCKEGNEFVAVTTQNSSKSYQIIKNLRKFFEEKSRFEKLKELYLVPGEEIYTEDGELLIVYPEDVKPEGIGHMEKHVNEADFMEKIDKAKNQEAVIILPHPFYNLFVDENTNLCMGQSIFDGKLNLKQEYKDFFSRVDAIEVLNGLGCLLYPFRYLCGSINEFVFQPIKKAVKICKKYGKPMLGNSDNHSPEFVGTAYTEVSGDPFKSIKKGETHPQLNIKKYFDIRTPLSQAIYHYKNGEFFTGLKIFEQLLISS